MAGVLIMDADRIWSASSAVFYWVVDTLADLAQDDDLADRLRELSEYNLGSLALDQLGPREGEDLLRAIADLPERAARTLPASDAREAVLDQIAELAGLAATAHPAGAD